MNAPLPALAQPLGLLTLAILVVVCTALGREIRRLVLGAAPATLYALTLDLASGLLGLHLLLLGLQVLGIRWTTVSVVAVLGLALALMRTLTRRRRTPRPPLRSPGRASWGDLVAAVAALAFAAAAWTLRATHPDFVYHWGIKAKKLLLAGGLDLRYLTRTWNHFVHPEYPTLVPELYTVTSLPGGFSEPVLLLWSVVFFAGLLIALRESLQRVAGSPVIRRAGLAFLALGLAGFAIGHRLAGGADLPLALALAAALPVVLAPRSRPQGDADDWSLGIAAAFAAAVKIEGVLLAATLVFLHGLRRWREGPRGTPRYDRLVRSARIALPSLAVVLPWLTINLRFGLFQASNSGAFEAERWPGIVAALADGLAVAHWHGLSYLVLATPLLLVFRRTRWVAVVVLVQVLFYLWVFFTLVGDAELLVRLSLPRLLLPLVPAVAVAGLALLPGDLRTPGRPRRHTG